MTVVLVRSYSRITGRRSLEQVRNTSSPSRSRRLAADPALVVRVGVGVEQADRDRPDAGRRQPPGRGLDARRVERPPDLAFGPHPLVRLQAQPARHQRLGAPVVQRIHFRNAQPAHLQDVAETLRGDEAGQRALALQHRVGRHGRAVHHPADGPRFEPGPTEQRRNAVADAPAVIVRR